MTFECIYELTCLSRGYNQMFIEELTDLGRGYNQMIIDKYRS